MKSATEQYRSLIEYYYWLVEEEEKVGEEEEKRRGLKKNNNDIDDGGVFYHIIIYYPHFLANRLFSVLTNWVLTDISSFYYTYILLFPLNTCIKHKIGQIAGLELLFLLLIQKQINSKSLHVPLNF